jgi:hypothetical protein
MEASKKRFNWRAFVALMAALTGLSLPISGFALHITRHLQNLKLIDFWMELHTFLGSVFVVFIIWHTVLNFHPLTSYLKPKAQALTPLPREAVFALLGFITLIIFGVSN